MACVRGVTSVRLQFPASHTLRRYTFASHPIPTTRCPRVLTGGAVVGCSVAARRVLIAAAARAPPRCTNVRVRAAAGNGDGGHAETEDTQTVVLTGKLGQNVRQGMDGWNTRVQVQKVRLSPRRNPARDAPGPKP
jgi:hypothetical protein